MGNKLKKSSLSAINYHPTNTEPQCCRPRKKKKKKKNRTLGLNINYRVPLANPMSHSCGTEQAEVGMGTPGTVWPEASGKPASSCCLCLGSWVRRARERVTEKLLFFLSAYCPSPRPQDCGICLGSNAPGQGHETPLSLRSAHCVLSALP